MGAYVNKNLISGEEIVYEAKNHWIKLFTVNFLAYLLGSNEYVITNKRVVAKEGIISRRVVEMNLSKIESINVDQGILGRILGFGSFMMIGTGGTRENFELVENPVKIKRVFQELVS